MENFYTVLHYTVQVDPLFRLPHQFSVPLHVTGLSGLSVGLISPIPEGELSFVALRDPEKLYCPYYRFSLILSAIVYGCLLKYLSEKFSDISAPC